MTNMQYMAPAVSGTRREGGTTMGLIAGFGPSRHSDGRLPAVTRRQRRINRQRRLN